MKRKIILLVVLLLALNASEVENTKVEATSMYDNIVNLFVDDNLSISEIRKQHFIEIWKDLFKEFEDSAMLEEELVFAPEKAWFKTDKRDLREDIDEKLNDIMEYLTHDNLLSYKDEVASLQEKITERKKDILLYREKKVGAPISSIVHKTKEDYDKKIKEAKEDIKVYKNEIRIIRNALALNLANIGVNLNEKQIDILLTRVDGDNFIQMSLSMDILSQITEQLMQLMKESNEELEQAKKYYAMHLVSLELVVKIQQKYIDKLDNDYIPKINDIIKQADEMIVRTNVSLNQDNNSKRKLIYKKNMENQKFTLKVAVLYKKQMLNQKAKVRQAQRTAQENLKLSRNTYRTVLLSADLYDMMSEDQQIFNKVMAIQIPEIVPFENIQIQKKYKELTVFLQKD